MLNIEKHNEKNNSNTIIKDCLMPYDTAGNEENNKEREHENENEKGNGEINLNAENTDAQNNSNNAGLLLIQSLLEHLLVKTSKHQEQP